MAITPFSSARLTRAVNNLEDAQKSLSIERLFKPDPDVITANEMEYGYDSDTPRILKVRKIHEGSSPIPFTTGTLRHLTFPKYRPSGVMTEEDARVLDPAVAAYVGRQSDPGDVLIDKIIKHMAKMRRYIRVSHLVNCFTILRTGKVTFQYEDGTTGELDVLYGSAGVTPESIIRTTLTGSTAPTAVWTDSAATPLHNLRTMASSIRATTGYTGRLGVGMGLAAADAFFDNATVKARLDNLRMDLGMAKFREDTEWQAIINNFNIYQWDYQYKLDTTWTQGWDTNTIVMFPEDDTEDSFSTVYGAPWEIPEGAKRAAFIPVPIFTKVIVKEDPVVEKIIMESRPVPVIKNPLLVRVWKVI